ncbi:hypothetical protein Taro_041396, partial [Colocasia esculenta]|nr:hypothetical protein [Colocasia esculenta]
LNRRGKVATGPPARRAPAALSLSLLTFPLTRTPARPLARSRGTAPRGAAMAGYNDYEAARKQRVQENHKRFEDLGIGTISKSLKAVVNKEHRILSYCANSKQKKGLENSELRRSSRARNMVSSYNDDRVDDLDLRSYRKRYGRRSYTEVRTASYEEHKRALTKAEKIQCNLNSGNPSFIKSMVRSHVSSCFWLGLPSRFCQDHLPPDEVYIVKAIDESRGDSDDKPSDTDMGATDRSVAGKPQIRSGSFKRVKRLPKRSDLM